MKISKEDLSNLNYNKLMLEKFQDENISFRRERIEVELDDGKFISVNSFKENRRKESNLTRLNSLYLDLDIQKDVDSTFSIHNKDSIEKYCDLVDSKCFELNIPLPSRIICSGRGLHVYWDLATFKNTFNKKSTFEVGISPDVINAYKFLQKELVNNFKDLGADNACKDISRVLRKVGTPTKNGGITSVCRIYKDRVQLNEENSIESTIDCLFSYKNYLSISQFENLFPYTYDDYKEFAKASQKQVDFFNDLQEEGHIHFNINVAKLNKFTIEKYITSGVKKRPATRKQIETVKKHSNIKLKGSTLSNLTMAEADTIIKSSLSNFNYVEKYLNEVYHLGFVGEGNRAMFTYYYAIGQKMIHSNMETEELLSHTIKKWETFNIDLPLKSVSKIMLSGFNYDGPGIKKSTLVDQFEGAYLIKNKKKKKVSLSNVQKIEDAIKKNIVENTQKSLREIARELNVSHTYVKKVKDKFFKRTKKTLENIEENKLVVTNELTLAEIANEVFELSNTVYKLESNYFAANLLYMLKLFGAV